jgi:hypothetical protein
VLLKTLTAEAAMNTSLLHKLWLLVEETQTSLLLQLNDSELVKHLLKQLNTKALLSQEQMDKMSDYISSKTTLIRDLAQARGI